MRTIDLNCDMGESFGPWKMGDDVAIMPNITSANIACGAHAGDPETMAATVRLAKSFGVAVGAHPGYPDLIGFGRRPLSLARDEVVHSILYQLGALRAIARSEDVGLSHVKTHGALYNQACKDRTLADAVIEAVCRFSTDLPIFGLPGSEMEAAARERGLSFVREGFADRAYEPSGSLRNRSEQGAVLTSPEAAAAQARQLAQGSVTCHEGLVLRMEIDTLCIHGDTPGAADIARHVRQALEADRVRVSAPSRLSGQD